MTTNIDRAAYVIHDTVQEWPQDDVPVIAAQRLADAGLLTRDLPEPIINADDGNPEWHAGEHTVDVERVMVRLWTPEGVPWWQTPNQARTLADALYAAADYAEKENSLTRILEGDTDE